MSCFSSEAETIKLYKLLNGAEKPNTVTGRSQSTGADNFMTQDFNRLMQLRPFYFDIQIKDAHDRSAIMVCEVKFGAKILSVYSPFNIKVK